jgi:hypothetical protein
MAVLQSIIAKIDGHTRLIVKGNRNALTIDSVVIP